MAASSPTVRRRRLSYLLKQLRAETDLRAEDVLKRLGWSKGKLTHIERNQWKRPSWTDVEKLLDLYGVTDVAFRASMEELTRQARQRGWWASYNDVVGSGTYIGLEAEAEQVRSYETLTIPGILQTEDYARAVIRAGGVADTRDVDRAVEVRMLRKQILERSDPPVVWAVLDEAALLKIPAELKQQLQHLLDVGRRPNIGIQVLPNAAGPHAAMSGPFVVLDFEGDPSAVYLEAMTEEIYLEEPDEIRRYGLIYDHLRGQAMSADASRDRITALLESL